MSMTDGRIDPDGYHVEVRPFGGDLGWLEWRAYRGENTEAFEMAVTPCRDTALVQAGIAIAYHAGKPEGGFPRFSVCEFGRAA